MSDIKLKKKIIYTGTIVLKTGLHIGGTNTALNIGGPDKFVVRNPITQLPYIPGSSLKGKMRSLIELAYGETDNGDVTKDPNTKAGKLFGVASEININNGHPSRIIVRDGKLKNPEELNNTDLLYTESKTEVTINRITAKPNPRTFERVPAGAKFNLEMVLNIFDGDNEDELRNTIKDAIRLLEDDYLGGNGSRGYGQVVFKEMKEEVKTAHPTNPVE